MRIKQHKDGELKVKAEKMELGETLTFKDKDVAVSLQRVLKKMDRVSTVKKEIKNTKVQYHITRLT
jgi:hypothetical protein